MPLGGLGRFGFGVVLTALLMAAGREPVRAQAPQNGPPPAVTTAVAEPATVPLSVSLPGRVVAEAESVVRPRVNGLIVKRHFTEGARVEKGDSLYQIDPRPFEVALDQARAELDRAEAQVTMLKARVARQKALLAQDNTSPSQVEEAVAALAGAQADVAAAKATRRQARLDLEFATVKAPVSGRVGRTRIQVGNLVSAGQEQPLTVITRTDPVLVDLQQTAAQALRVKRLVGDPAGRSVSYSFADDSGTSFDQQGEVLFGEVRVEPATGAVVLRSRVANPDGVLLPGLFLRGVVSLGERSGVFLIPQRATVRDPEGRLRLWVVGDDNTATPVLLRDSGSHDGHWIIEEGLSAGTRYVLEGYQALRPGMKVRPSATDAAPGKSGGEQG